MDDWAEARDLNEISGGRFVLRHGKSPLNQLYMGIDPLKAKVKMRDRLKS